MSITKEIFQDSRLGVLWHNVRPLARDDFDRVFGTLDDMNDSDRQKIAHEFWQQNEEMRKAIAALFESHDLSIRIHGSGLVCAAQRLVITANDLSTTSVADDTITTLSETNHEFNWGDARRLSRIVLSPAETVGEMRLIYNKITADLPVQASDYQSIAWGASATTLQKLDWDSVNSEWDGQAWNAGWVCDLLQIFAGGMETL